MMIQANRLFYRTSAIFLVLCLAVNSVSFAASLTHPIPQVATAAPFLDDIRIPSQLGTIQKSVYFQKYNSNLPTVIHIQDAHGSYEAQVHTQKILQHLRQSYGLDTIYMEGAFGKLEPKYLEFFKNPEQNQKAAHELAKRGLVSGAELFLLQEHQKKSASVQGWGIEDLASYKENLETFRWVMSNHGQALKDIEIKRAALLKNASFTLNATLRKFFKDTLQSDLLSPKSIPTLLAYGKESLDIDFLKARQQMEWPQLVRFAKLRSIESQVHQEKAKRELTLLIQWMNRQNKVSFKTFQDGFEAMFQRHRFEEMFQDSPRQFIEAFYEAAAPVGFHFETYPALTLFLGSVILSSEMDATALFQEVEKLQTQILDHLAKTSDEKKIIQDYKQLALIEKLIKLELTRDEYGRIQKQLNLSPLNHEIRRTAAKALHFYAGAQARETVMSERLKERLSQNKAKCVAMITGGFHKEGLNALFDAHRIKHLDILPRLSEAPDPKIYYKSMMLQGALPDRSHILRHLILDGGVVQARALGSDDAHFLTGSMREVIAQVGGSEAAAAFNPTAHSEVRVLNTPRSEVRFDVEKMQQELDEELQPHKLAGLLNSWRQLTEKPPQPSFFIFHIAPAILKDYAEAFSGGIKQIMKEGLLTAVQNFFHDGMQELSGFSTSVNETVPVLPDAVLVEISGSKHEKRVAQLDFPGQLKVFIVHRPEEVLARIQKGEIEKSVLEKAHAIVLLGQASVSSFRKEFPRQVVISIPHGFYQEVSIDEGRFTPEASVIIGSMSGFGEMRGLEDAVKFIRAVKSEAASDEGKRIFGYLGGSVDRKIENIDRFRRDQDVFILDTETIRGAFAESAFNDAASYRAWVIQKAQGRIVIRDGITGTMDQFGKVTAWEHELLDFNLQFFRESVNVDLIPNGTLPSKRIHEQGPIKVEYSGAIHRGGVPAIHVVADSLSMRDVADNEGFKMVLVPVNENKITIRYEEGAKQVLELIRHLDQRRAMLQKNIEVSKSLSMPVIAFAYDHLLRKLWMAVLEEREQRKKKMAQELEAHFKRTWGEDNQLVYSLRELTQQFAVPHDLTEQDVLDYLQPFSQTWPIKKKPEDKFGLSFLREVDPETGEPTDRLVEFKHAHEIGVWHESVHVVAVTKGGQELALSTRATNFPNETGEFESGKARIILQHRVDKQMQSRLDLTATGHREPGATIIGAAMGEINEELGLFKAGITLNGEQFQILNDPLTRKPFFRKIGKKDFKGTVGYDEHGIYHSVSKEQDNRELIRLVRVEISDEQMSTLIAHMKKTGGTAEVSDIALMSPEDLGRLAEAQPEKFASGVTAYFLPSTMRAAIIPVMTASQEGPRSEVRQQGNASRVVARTPAVFETAIGVARGAALKTIQPGSEEPYASRFLRAVAPEEFTTLGRQTRVDADKVAVQKVFLSRLFSDDTLRMQLGLAPVDSQATSGSGQVMLSMEAFQGLDAAQMFQAVLPFFALEADGFFSPQGSSYLFAGETAGIVQEALFNRKTPITASQRIALSRVIAVRPENYSKAAQKTIENVSNQKTVVLSASQHQVEGLLHRALLALEQNLFDTRLSYEANARAYYVRARLLKELAAQLNSRTHPISAAEIKEYTIAFFRQNLGLAVDISGGTLMGLTLSAIDARLRAIERIASAA